jgi:hypothetical protein
VTQLFDLAGSYTLHPGALSSITGRRPIMAPGLLTRLLRGQSAEQVERLLGQLFALCAHAHRHTARLALSAARLPDQTLLPAAASQQLAQHTALDHLRSMVMDWPHAGPVWPAPCPLPLAQTDQNLSETQAAAQLAQLRRWLEHDVLQQAAADWLAQHQEPDALLAWCQRRAPEVSVARFLADNHAVASALTTNCVPLTLLDTNPNRQVNNLRQLAHALANDDTFAARPTWQGQPAETGAWTRLHHSAKAQRTATSGGLTAWSRLASRWVDLVDICLTGTSTVASASSLSSGALALGHGQAVAWCEMARGLLLHWVQLDAQGHVEAYQVVAPTEWNFHPAGSLAKALTRLAPEDSAAASLLGQAFDACVPCQVSQATAQETVDA